MLILNAISNGLACGFGVSRVLIMICQRFCKKYFTEKWGVLIVYYIWYIEFIESYYFLCVKKTIEHVYQNMYLLICNLIVMAFFKCSKYTILRLTLKLRQNVIFCCCLATKNFQSN